MDLTVATFNLRNSLGREWEHLWWRRRGITLATIRLLDADMIGFQEAHWWQYRWLARKLGPEWHHAGAGRSRRGHLGEHVPLFARRSRLTVLDERTRWFGDQPTTPGTTLPDASFPRITTSFRARPVDGERTISVFNTHLDEHLAANRRRSVAQLRDWAAETGDPAVIMGDLNAELDRDELEPLLGSGYRSVLPRDSGSTAHGYTGEIEGEAIDHILVSPEWTVIDAHIETRRPGGRLPSDHWPVVATLRVT
jgi:endonuclease/exonuclease/phosphatase family metal-dependent hydrolase